MDAVKKKLRPVPFFLFLAACAPPPAPQAPAEPRRIVSLIPAVTEILFAVGAGLKVVGVGSYDQFPPEIAQLPRVGGLIDPDTERILSLTPDLAFLYGSQQDLITQLKAAGIAVETYRHGNLPEVIGSIRSIATRVGRTSDGARVADGIERAIAETRARVAGKPAPRVLIVFGREEGTLRGIYASGGAGFINDMLVAAGGRNAFEDVARENVQASLESIIARAPDVILEIRAPAERAGAGPASIVEPWRAAPSIPAVRNGRVYALTDERLVVPGPRIAGGIRLIEQALWK